MREKSVNDMKKAMFLLAILATLMSIALFAPVLTPLMMDIEHTMTANGNYDVGYFTAIEDNALTILLPTSAMIYRNRFSVTIINAKGIMAAISTDVFPIINILVALPNVSLSIAISIAGAISAVLIAFAMGCAFPRKPPWKMALAGMVNVEGSDCFTKKDEGVDITPNFHRISGLIFATSVT